MLGDTHHLPPGVFVDKQTSLLLAPALDDDKELATAAAAALNCNDYSAANIINGIDSRLDSSLIETNDVIPRVRNDEECYVEEDMHSLLSSSYYNDDVSCLYDEDDSVFTSGTGGNKNGKKKNGKLGRLQWRPPGMRRIKQRKPSAAAAALPPHPNGGNRNYQSFGSSTDSVYGSVYTLKSSHTSFSSSTQKAGNRTKSNNAPAAAASDKSKTRSHQRSSPRSILRNGLSKQQQQTSPSRPSTRRNSSKKEEVGGGAVENKLDNIIMGNESHVPPQSSLTSAADDKNNNSSSSSSDNTQLKRSRRLRLLIQRQCEEDERQRGQEVAVRRNLDSLSSPNNKKNDKHTTDNNNINNADDGIELVPSPTSVTKDVTVLSTSVDDTNYKMDGMGLESISEDYVPNTTDTTFYNNSSSNNSNNAIKRTLLFDKNKCTENDRNAGPIDIDTCSPIVVSSSSSPQRSQRSSTSSAPPVINEIERRNLAAMHKLGYTHLRNNEITQAITIFTEILRGQKERHGPLSLQAAMAMHNLGVVYVKSRQYYETSMLCEMASKIRREELGPDHLDVAVSLAQMGVALMELSKFEEALVVFREALRIRRVCLGNDVNHQLIVRILNNIGCALFELEKMEEARAAFEETLCMQRELMKVHAANGMNGDKDKKMGGNNLERGRSGNSIGSGDLSSSIVGADNKKDSHQMLLSIALTLCNLGSIHLRTGELDASFLVFEEALLVSFCVWNHCLVLYHSLTTIMYPTQYFFSLALAHPDSRISPRGKSQDSFEHKGKLKFCQPVH